MPEPATLREVPSVVALNTGIPGLIAQTWEMNVPGGEGLFSSNPYQCNSLNSDSRNVLGRFPNGDIVFYSGRASLMQNTIESPLADGGLEAVNSGARICSNSAKTFLNIESCFLNAADACESTANTRNRSDWQPKIVKNAVICGSESEVSNDVNNIDLSGPKFFLPGHSTGPSLHLQIKAVAYTVFLTAHDQLRQRYDNFFFTS